MLSKTIITPTSTNASDCNFDLNLQNYKKEELEDIFELPSSYSQNMLENKATKLQDNIYSDITMEISIKNSTVSFIQQAKNFLLEQLNVKNDETIPTTTIYNVDYNLKPAKTQDIGADYTIIEKKPTPFTQSYPSEFFPGVINPLKKRVINRSLNIDTRFRNNYYTTQSTNFHLDLPIKFSNIVSMQLSAFEFPNTVYTISKQFGTNFFWLTATSSIYSSEEKACLIVPNGNYSPADLVEVLNNYISVSPDFTGSNYLKYIKFELNLGGVQSTSGSGKIVAGISSDYEGDDFGFSLNFQLDSNGNPDYSTPLPLKLGWLMGFREGLYENNTCYVGEGVADTTGPNYLYLVVDDFNNNVNNNFYSAFNSSVLNKNILARISLQTPPFNNLLQNNLNLVTSPRQYFGPIDIQKMQIQLLDEYGRIIDLNNMDYSFCLTMQMVYDI